MSEHDRAGQLGQNGASSCVGNDIIRAAIAGSLANMLTIKTGPGGRGGISPSGLAHSVGVALLEMSIMARGKGKRVDAGSGAGMPKFVDVKLSVQDRSDFQAWPWKSADLVVALQRLADQQYRVGCAWSVEHESYTVSVTCRDAESPNAGLCMTSFAGRLDTAIALAVWKHTVLTGEVWLGDSSPDAEAFG